MADDFDFSKPAAGGKPVPAAAPSAAQDTVYSPALALEFFRATGTV